MDDFLDSIRWDSWSDEATTALRIALIAIAVFAGMRILGRILEPAIRRTVVAQMAGQPQVEIDKRVSTLTGVLHTTTWVVVILLGLMTTLPEVGVNIGALLAGTSLIALAVGFGAQSLVKDVIAGIFILVENQYGRGDVVNIGGVGGVVEEVNLRRTVLRDLDGAIHVVPNGAVTVASNLTRTFSRVNMIIAVSYSEDMDAVFKVINRVGEELAADATWSQDIVEAPKVLGIEQFSDTGVEVRILGTTQPIRQWDVMRELRRRLKIAFDEAGIEIPSHRVLVASGQKATDGH